jgi:translation elongation factor EF-Tu-like GTPase
MIQLGTKILELMEAVDAWIEEPEMLQAFLDAC